MQSEWSRNLSIGFRSYMKVNKCDFTLLLSPLLPQAQNVCRWPTHLRNHLYIVMIEKSVAMPKTSAPVPAPLNTCLHNCLKKTLEQTTCQTSPWQHKCWVWLCFRSASGDVSGSVPSHPGSATSRPLPPPQLHSGWEQKFPLGPDCCSISVDWTVCCRSYQFPTAENLQDTPLGRCVLQDLAYLFLLVLLTILPSTPMITNLFISLKEPFIFYLFLVQWATSWKGVFCAQQDYRGADTQLWVGLRAIDIFLPNIFGSSWKL